VETWTTIIVALIVALSTLGAAFLGNKASEKRFEKELERAKKAESSQRRWEVRNKPLRKLSDELAIMASELDVLIATGQAQSKHNFTEGSKRDIAAQKIYDKWEKYRTSGDFLKTLHLQYDVELLEAVDAIKMQYLLLFEYALEYKQLKPDERKTFMETSEEINKKIPSTQDLINKRLEEL